MAFISGSEVQPQPRSAATESCCLLTPLQQPAGKPDGCPHTSQPQHSLCPHLAGQACLLPAPPESRPPPDSGDMAHSSCAEPWGRARSSCKAQAHLGALSTPFHGAPLPRKACPYALFYQTGEIRGLEHCLWRTTSNPFIFPRSDACRGEDLVRGQQDPNTSLAKLSDKEPLGLRAPIPLEALDGGLPAPPTQVLETLGAEPAPAQRGEAPAEQSSCHPRGCRPGPRCRNMIPIAGEYVRTDDQGGQRAAFQQSAGPLSVALGS